MSEPKTEQKSNAQILVVDDNSVNCELLEAMLEPQGYDVLQAYSGHDALHVAQHTRPDMILLDVNMPEMDGFEVARRLRANEMTKLIPVVMVTALGDLDHRVQGLESGADDYLAKPVSQMELLARVQSTLRLSWLRRQVDERQKLELVLGDVSDGIVIVDATGRVREVSPSAKRLLGLEQVGASVDELCRELEGAPDDLTEAVRHGEVRDFVLHREEPVLFLSVSVRPVFDPEGHSTGAVLSLRDVTRETLEHKLQQDLLSLVSHKFRTPLTIVTSWVQVLAEEGCGPISAPQKEALSAITAAANDLRDLLDGMLSFLEWTQRLHHMQRRAVHFIDIAQDLHERARLEFGSHLDLVVHHAADGMIVVDRALFVEALLELLRNATKFSGSSCVQVEVTMRTDGERAVVEVQDHGVGIAPEKLERIFDRFYQVENEFTGQVHGLGLGLAMVKRAMDAMGAELSVSSRLQHGVHFTIRI
ncbi:MAG: response regulator [Candidatus Latescibacterota bacterium]|nr:MAG: response regulator [Candidatus Latescibacterota bacterium]